MNKRIVNLRALAILIVVLGHSIILYSSAWSLYETNVVCPVLDRIKEVINLIQMPLFFSLSGYLFYYAQKKKRNFGIFVMDKVRRLLIPYIAIAVLWLIPVRLLVQYPGYVGNSFVSFIWNKIIVGTDNGHLWFLTALFLIFVVMYAVCSFLYRRNSKALYGIVFWVLLCISIYAQEINILIHIKNALRYMVWFYMGFLINHGERRWMENKKAVLLLVGVLSVIAIIGYYISRDSLFTYPIAAFVLIWLYTAMPEKENKVTELLDKNSFGIYLFHSPLIYITFSQIPNASPVIVVGLNFLVFGAAALGLTCLVRKLKLGFLVGEYKKTKR